MRDAMTDEFFQPERMVEVLSIFTTCCPVALSGAAGLMFRRIRNFHGGGANICLAHAKVALATTLA